MKNLSQILVLGWLIGMAPLSNGCTKKTDTSSSCISQTANESSIVNTYVAPTNQLIAIFNFSQQVNSFADVECGQSSYGATSLTITNATSQSISFNYIVTVTVGFVSWQYQGTAVIAGNGNFNVGVINSTNAQRIHVGAINIQLFNVT